MAGYPDSEVYDANRDRDARARAWSVFAVGHGYARKNAWNLGLDLDDYNRVLDTGDLLPKNQDSVPMATFLEVPEETVS